MNDFESPLYEARTLPTHDLDADVAACLGPIITALTGTDRQEDQ